MWSAILFSCCDICCKDFNCLALVKRPQGLRPKQPNGHHLIWERFKPFLPPYIYLVPFGFPCCTVCLFVIKLKWHFTTSPCTCLCILLEAGHKVFRFTYQQLVSCNMLHATYSLAACCLTSHINMSFRSLSLSLSLSCCRSTVHFYFHGIILYFDRVFFMRGFVETVFHQVFGSLGLTEIKCYLFGLYALRYAPISVPINQIGAARELGIPSLFFLRHKKRDLHTFFQGGDLFEKKGEFVECFFSLIYFKAFIWLFSCWFSWALHNFALISSIKLRK